MAVAHDVRDRSRRSRFNRGVRALSNSGTICRECDLYELRMKPRSRIAERRTRRLLLFHQRLQRRLAHDRKDDVEHDIRISLQIGPHRRVE
jgi:hypothetical protein